VMRISSDHPRAPDHSDITVHPSGAGSIITLSGLAPACARVAEEQSGWSVSLIALRFDSRPEIVAQGLASFDAAVEAAAVALRAIRVTERRDDYHFRRDPHGPNKWYIDTTARGPLPWSGRLPDLSGSDEEIRTHRLRDVQAYLDATFPVLVNLAQHTPHTDPARGRTTDPSEHTAEVMAQLNTTSLTEHERYIVRVAVLYHDVGKSADSYDPRHPLVSARLAAPFLEQHDLSESERQQVLIHIRQHDLLGTLSRHRMTTREAIERLELHLEPRNLLLHDAITTADISAIRGLAWIVRDGAIARARDQLAAALAVEQGRRDMP